MAHSIPTPTETVVLAAYRLVNTRRALDEAATAAAAAKADADLSTAEKVDATHRRTVAESDWADAHGCYWHATTREHIDAGILADLDAAVRHPEHPRMLTAAAKAARQAVA
ncbi:hypothetical protein [Corynebacterium neomassiliense]|uniref:hypothetical protein n=1 Tax=Corynebacterium neomassiliense TaxID=2079482 RepID=UPI001030F8D6|nr:hypothetical protein [Corynebacterium neomassiliense]